MGTEIEARDIAPSIIKREMQAHKITHQLPIPLQNKTAKYNVSFKTSDVSCKGGKRHGTWGEEGKGLTPPASKFVPRILLIVSNRGGEGTRPATYRSLKIRGITYETKYDEKRGI